MLKNYNQIVYPSQEVATLVDDIVTNKMEFPKHGKNGLLIYGPNGTGKSTLAGLLPPDMELHRTGNRNASVSFFNVASGQNGTALLSRIAITAENVAINLGKQYFILDEIDNLGEQSMKSFKSIMNNDNAIFLMTTNNYDLIDKGVISRCHEIPMFAPPPALWLPAARAALAALGVTKPIPDEGLLPYIKNCNGDARKIMTQWHQIALDIQRGII